ncbi:MAG: phosphate signaling complex protein PhoU [Candidatus Omnitrophica bacterium]|nr:phosphate signaling complex protein PhoU [Candidatus Omnitrophota bacterium]MCM8793769.1 phosphate signaling complex protein PhoU [Candidatus Omnitrophota bacterium]
MERHFDEELNQLKKELLRMASLAEEAVAKAIKALEKRDESICRQVLAEEERINMLEIDIEEMCLRLLALRQPMAVDLRFITSAMKINNDLERIGDLAVNIAERTLDLLTEPLLKPLIDIPRMAMIVQGMVRDVLEAFIKGDSKLAREVCRRDDEVDNLNDQIFRELLTYMISDPKTIKRALDLILVARNLERVADHATNIGEDVFYLVEGRTIKHHIEEKQSDK